MLSRAADPNQPIEITLKPTRLVRARLFETPVDNPSDYLGWHAYSVDATVGNLHYVDKIRKAGAFWEYGKTGIPERSGSLDQLAGLRSFWRPAATVSRSSPTP